MYDKNTVIVLANSFKNSGLHEKISMRVIRLFGSDPKWYSTSSFSIAINHV